MEWNFFKNARCAFNDCAARKVSVDAQAYAAIKSQYDDSLAIIKGMPGDQRWGDLSATPKHALPDAPQSPGPNDRVTVSESALEQMITYTERVALPWMEESAIQTRDGPHSAHGAGAAGRADDVVAQIREDLERLRSSATPLEAAPVEATSTPSAAVGARPGG